MKKRILSFVLSFAMLLSVLPAAAMAEELPVSGDGVAAVDTLPDEGLAAESQTEQETPAEQEAQEDPDQPAQLDAETGETEGVYTFIVPSDATLLVTDTEMYKGQTEFVPVDTAVNSPSGMTTYSFAATDTKTHCMFRVDGEDYITYAGSAYMTAGGSMTITKQMLKPAGQTQTMLDRDPMSHGGVNVCDLYMNINSEGYLKMPSVGSRYQFVGLRNWWTTNRDWTMGGGYMWFQPNYHYTVLDENGEPSNAVVSVDENGVITANGNGTAIVKVTYDAINIAYDSADSSKGNGVKDSYASNGFFGALWPENTGVFVVTVGAGDSGIDKGTTLEFPNGTRAVDADFDVIYFTGDSGSYSFTPATSGVTVSVANPTVGSYDDCNSMTFSGFRTLTANADGSYDVPLTDGRNILKLEKDGKANYQVLNAKKTNITVNGMPLDECVVCAGEELSIKFDTLFNPLNRNQYINGDVAPMYYTLSGLPGKHAGTGRGPYGYYFFPSNEAKHTLHSFLVETDDGTQWHNPIVQEDGELTIPADFTGDTFDMTLGTFNTAGFGEIGAFRTRLGGFLDENGDLIESQSGDDLVAEQDMAPGVFGYIAKLPDLSIPVSTLDSISVTVIPNKTVYGLNESINTDGMVVTARYSNGMTKNVTADCTISFDSSTVGDKTVAISYTQGGVTATTEMTVNVNDVHITSLEITTPPTYTKKYYPTESFKPAGMVITAYYSDGTSKVLDSADYTITPEVFDNSEWNVPVTISAGGQSVVFPVIVDLTVKMELAEELDTSNLPAGRRIGSIFGDIRISYIKGDGTVKKTGCFTFDSSPISRVLTVYDDKFVTTLPNISKRWMTLKGVEPLVVPLTVVDDDIGTPITVYATCDDKGEWLTGTDGTTIKDVPLTVYDLDKDGKYTMVDAWVTLHHFYCPDDAAGYDEYVNTSAYGSSSTKRFWGCFSPDMIYACNGEVVKDSGTELVDGDKITGHINADKKDLYAWFDQASYTAAAGERSIFQVSGKATADDWTAAPSGANVTVYNSAGEKQEELTATVDQDGYFAIRFPYAGTYTVEVTGACTYKDKSGTAVSGVSVSPARCTVEVTSSSGSDPEPDSITAYLSLTEDGEIAASGRTLLYHVPVDVYDTNGDGKYTIGEAFQAFHTEYYSGGIRGYVEDEKGWITRFWGEETANLSYTLNNGWVSGALTQIKDNDSLSMYFYEDTDRYSDLYTWFQPEEAQARTQVEKLFEVNGLNVMNSGESFAAKAAPVGAAITVYDGDGKELTELNTKTDAMGQFTVTFPEIGTYTVEVSGTCAYTCVAYDGSAGLHFDNATVIPARCTVTVTKSSGSLPANAAGVSDSAAAAAVDKIIDAIGTVTANSKDKIASARAAYDKLTDAQKQLVKNYDTLVKAETELAKLTVGVPFVDVEKHWALDAIKYAYDNKLMNGVDASKFAPDATLTRAMLVTVLYRMAGSPAVSGESRFTDVASGEWYAAAVKWAADNGIVEGVSEHTFAPTANITREQFAAMLYRYAQYMKYSVADTAELDKFADAESVSDWAQAAMKWAVGAGLITGRTAATVAPGGTATRGEAATLLMRFGQNVAK